MWISLDHKAIFLHNPRCAGTAIGESLSREGFKLSHEIFYNSDKSNHSVKIPFVIRNFFKFTTCRNPYTRIISEWNWRSRRGKTSLKFEDYISNSVYEKQLKYLVKADKIYRFEDFTKSNRLHLPFGCLTLRKINFSGKNNISICSNKLSDLIYNRYFDDFNFLGYDKLIFNGCSKVN